MNRLHISCAVLILCGVFLFVQAYTLQNMMLVIIGVFVIVLALLRIALIAQQSKIKAYDIPVDNDMFMKFFKQNEALYADMIYAYTQCGAKLLYGERDGVLLYNTKNDQYLATAQSEQAAQEIVQLVPKGYDSFVAHDVIFEKYMGKLLSYTHSLESYNHVYKKRQLFVLKASEIQIKKLDGTYKETIKKHYTLAQSFSDAYFDGCFQRGFLGAFEKEKLVGFIGMHENGAMGMLEVFDGYKGRKIGTLLQCSYVNYLMSKKYKPIIFSQVNAKNDISLRLQEKTYFEKASQKCLWYFDKK